MQIEKNLHYQRIISTLVALYPLSYALGNMAINLNTIFIIFFGIFFFKGKLFNIDEKFYTSIMLLFFSFLILTTLINNLNFSDSEMQKLNIKKSFMFLRYLLLFLVISQFCKKNLINFKYLFISSSIIIILLCLDIFFQFSFGKDIFGIEPIPRHYTGFFGNELVAGSYIQKFSFFLILFFFVFQFNLSRNKKIILSSGFIIFTFAALILAGNRMPVLMYVMSLIAICFLTKKFRKLFLSFLLISFVIFAFFLKNNEDTKNDFLQFYTHSIEIITIFPKIIYDYEYKEGDEFHSHHLQTFNAAIITWKNKITGGGIRSLRTNCPKIFNTSVNPKKDRRCNWHPHNYYIEILIDMGAIGLILFLILFYIPIFIFLKRFLLSKGNLSHLFFLIPTFLILAFEIFPIRTTGSFFSTFNATIIFFTLGIITNLKNYNKIESFKSKLKH